MNAPLHVDPDTLRAAAHHWMLLITELDDGSPPSVEVVDWPSGAAVTGLHGAVSEVNGAMVVRLTGTATHATDAAASYQHADGQGGDGLKHVGEGMSAFTGPAKDMMGAATGAIKDITSATTGAVGDVAKALNSPLSSLGSMLSSLTGGAGAHAHTADMTSLGAPPDQLPPEDPRHDPRHKGDVA